MSVRCSVTSKANASRSRCPPKTPPRLRRNGSPPPGPAHQQRRGCATPPPRSAWNGARPPTGPDAANGPVPQPRSATNRRNPFHTSGNAHRARLINRRRCRLPSITEPPRRTHALRNANCAGSTGRSGCRSNTSPARANVGVDHITLCLPLIARAAGPHAGPQQRQIAASLSQRHRQPQPRHRRRLRHRHHTRHLGQPVAQ